MFACMMSLCDNICLSRVRIVSLDTDVAVISLYESVINFTFWDAIWFETGAEEDQRYIHLYLIHLLGSDLTDLINFGEFPLLPLEVCLFLLQCVMYVIFRKKINQVQVWMNYDIATMFTKNNLNGDRLPSILDALLLHRRRVLIFFH